MKSEVVLLVDGHRGRYNWAHLAQEHGPLIWLNDAQVLPPWELEILKDADHEEYYEIVDKVLNGSSFVWEKGEAGSWLRMLFLRANAEGDIFGVPVDLIASFDEEMEQ